MRVHFPFRGNTVGGSHLSAITLINSLPKIGVQPLVTIHQQGPVEDLLTKNNIPFEIINLKFIEAPGGFRAIAQLPRIVALSNFLKSRSVDIVHANDGAMTNTWVPAAKLAGKPSLVHIRRVWRPSRISDLLHLQAGHFIAISEFVKSSFPEAACDRATVVTNPVVQPDTTKAPKIYDRQTVVMVASHTRQKRPELFIAAAASVVARLPNVRFLLIGRVTEYTDVLRQLVIEAGLNKRFYIAGYTSLVAHKIAQAALLVAPAVEEGHGRTLIEAMMLNTPVAASRSGGHVEIVQDGINGRLFEADDPVSMAEVIIEMLSKPDDTTAMTRHAATFAQNTFTAESHAQTVTNIYQRLALG